MNSAAAVPMYRSGVGRLALGAYAWLYSVSLGLIVLDVIYARQLRTGIDASVTAGIFSEISDFLLFVWGVVVLAGALALAVGWQARAVRRLILASLLLPLAVVLLAVLIAPVLQTTGLGTGLRLLSSGLGSVLAMLGAVWFSSRQSA